jgi:hypothetical protein
MAGVLTEQNNTGEKPACPSFILPAPHFFLSYTNDCLPYGLNT